MSLPALALPRPEPRPDPRPRPGSNALRTWSGPADLPSPVAVERLSGAPADPGPPDRSSPLRRLRHRLATLLRALAARITADDRGMSTVEYAIGTLAAAAFAAVLYTVISGDSIVTALTQLVQRALSVTF
ncbi:hypothetical protein GCM10010472_54580 [Pseudonocardia halophobica]|uniref:DUF4244 domain-containing protein n=1 Tax=Pseudonocardia halophobica TaxID=29401 RepID=A0A9W6L0R2_9PSEU|nr:DUF4244 domain-containing protein [Pseudonocardia halophobica]GLL11536.1 hypothetical protein GCM10017577_26770 [Pseudonocardia halophobica]